MRRVSKMFQHGTGHGDNSNHHSGKGRRRRSTSGDRHKNNAKKSSRRPVGDSEDPERAVIITSSTDLSHHHSDHDMRAKASPVSSTFRKIKRQSSTKAIKKIVNKTLSMSVSAGKGLLSPMTGSRGGAYNNNSNTNNNSNRIRARSLDRKHKHSKLSITHDDSNRKQDPVGDTSGLVLTQSYETEGSSSRLLMKRASSSSGINSSIRNINNTAATTTLRRPSIMDVDVSGLELAPLDLLNASTANPEKQKDDALTSSGSDNQRIRRRTYANKDPSEPTNLSRRMSAATTAEILAALEADGDEGNDTEMVTLKKGEKGNGDPMSKSDYNDLDISTLVVAPSNKRRQSQNEVVDISATLPVSPRRLKPIHQPSEHLQIEAEDDTDEDIKHKKRNPTTSMANIDDVVVNKDGVAAAIAELEAMRKKPPASVPAPPTPTQKLAPSSKDTHRSKTRRGSKDAKQLHRAQQKIQVMMSDSTSKLPTMKAQALSRGTNKHKSRRRISVANDGRDANNRPALAASLKQDKLQQQQQPDHGAVETASDASTIPILPSMEDLLKSPSKLVIHSEAHGVVETTMTREQLMSPDVTKVVKRLPNGHLFISAKGATSKLFTGEEGDGKGALNILDVSSPGGDQKGSGGKKKSSSRRRKTVGTNMNGSSNVGALGASSERSFKARRRATTGVPKSSSERNLKSSKISSSTSRNNNVAAGKRRSSQQKRRVSGSNIKQSPGELATALREKEPKESRGELNRAKSTSSINSVVLREDILKAAQANLALATKATALVAQAKQSAGNSYNFLEGTDHRKPSSRKIEFPGTTSTKSRQRKSKSSSKLLRRSQTTPPEKTTSGELSALQPSKAAEKESSTVITPPPPLKCISPQKKAKTPMSSKVKKRLSVADAADFGGELPLLVDQDLGEKKKSNKFSLNAVEKVSMDVASSPPAPATTKNRSVRSRSRSKHSTHLRNAEEATAKPTTANYASLSSVSKKAAVEAGRTAPPRKLPARQTQQSSTTADIFKQNYVVARSQSPKDSRRRPETSSGVSATKDNRKEKTWRYNSSDSDIMFSPENQSQFESRRRRAKSMSHITDNSTHFMGDSSPTTSFAPAETSADDYLGYTYVIPSLLDEAPVSPVAKVKKMKKKRSKSIAATESTNPNHRSLGSIESSLVSQKPRRTGRRQQRRKTLTCDGRDSFDDYEQPASVTALQRSLEPDPDSVFRSNHAVHRSTTPVAYMEDFSNGDSTWNDIKSFATHEGKSFSTQSVSGTDELSNPGQVIAATADTSLAQTGSGIAAVAHSDQSTKNESTVEMPDGSHATSMEELESIGEGDSLLNDVKSFATLDSPARGKTNIGTHLAEVEGRESNPNNALSDACDSVVLSKGTKYRRKDKAHRGPALARVARRRSWGNAGISEYQDSYIDKKGDFSPKAPPRRSFSFDSQNTYSIRPGKLAGACDSVVLAQSQIINDDDSDIFSAEGDGVAQALREKKEKVPPWQRPYDPRSQHTRSDSGRMSDSGRLSSICDSSAVPTSQRKGLWDADDDMDMFSDAGDSVAMAMKVKQVEKKVPPWQVSHDPPSVSGGLSSVCSSGVVPMSQRKGLWDVDDDDDLFSDAGDSVGMARKSKKAKEQRLKHQQQLQNLPEEQSSVEGSIEGARNSTSSINQNLLPSISADESAKVDHSPRMPRKTTASQPVNSVKNMRSVPEANKGQAMVDRSPRMPRKSSTRRASLTPGSPSLAHHFGEAKSNDKVPKLPPRKSNSFESAVSGLGPLPKSKTPLFALPFGDDPNDEKPGSSQIVMQVKIGPDGQRKLSNVRSVSASSLRTTPSSITKPSTRPTLLCHSAVQRGGGGSARNLVSGQSGSERHLLRSPHSVGGGMAKEGAASERISTRSVPKGRRLDRSASAREVSRGRLDRSVSGSARNLAMDSRRRLERSVSGSARNLMGASERVNQRPSRNPGPSPKTKKDRLMFDSPPTTRAALGATIKAMGGAMGHSFSEFGRSSRWSSGQD